MKNLIFVLLFFVCSVILAGCNGDTNGPDTKPSLSNLVIPAKMVLTCYAFQSRFPTPSKNDSMTISFDCNSKKISMFSIEGTIDSGRSWFPITQLTASSAGHEEFIWSPKDGNPEDFKYCDEKKCVIRVTSTTTDTLISDEFYLIGSEPAELMNPKQGDRFDVTDSLKVEFNCNLELLTDIDISFYTDDVEKRVQFSEDNSRMIVTTGINANLKKFTYFFPLLRYQDKFTENPSVVSIMISDYAQSRFFQIVDSITITQP